MHQTTVFVTFRYFRPSQIFDRKARSLTEEWSSTRCSTSGRFIETKCKKKCLKKFYRIGQRIMIEDIQSSSSFFSVAPHEETFTPNHPAGAKKAPLEIG
jgi:hypothetical protein